MKTAPNLDWQGTLTASMSGCLISINAHLPMSLEQYEALNEIYEDLVSMQMWIVHNIPREPKP